MNHRPGLDRSQTLLFPERLEDYIAAEKPVRFLDAFVSSLGLHELGFAKARYADTGRPPYDPAVLLKLYLYGYLHRLRSSRLLEAECHCNVEVIWLTGKQMPHFKTIADFRKDNLQPLKAVARQFTLLCRKLELFGGELLAIDGSKFAAVNARERVSPIRVTLFLIFAVHCWLQELVIFCAGAGACGQAFCSSAHLFIAFVALV